PAQLFHDHCIRGDVEAQAAELLRDGGAEEAHLLHASDQRVWILVAMLELAGYRQDFALDEAPDGGNDLFSLFGCECHHALRGETLRHVNHVWASRANSPAW